MMPAISAGLRFIAALSEAPRTRGRPGQHPALRWTELSDRLGVRDPPFEPGPCRRSIRPSFGPRPEDGSPEGWPSRSVVDWGFHRLAGSAMR
jgi:hypothetical protein